MFCFAYNFCIACCFICIHSMRFSVFVGRAFVHSDNLEIENKDEHPSRAASSSKAKPSVNTRKVTTRQRKEADHQPSKSTRKIEEPSNSVRQSTRRKVSGKNLIESVDYGMKIRHFVHKNFAFNSSYH